MSPPPDGVTAQSHWPCGTAIRTYSLYFKRSLTVPLPVLFLALLLWHFLRWHKDREGICCWRVWCRTAGGGWLGQWCRKLSKAGALPLLLLGQWCGESQGQLGLFIQSIEEDINPYTYRKTSSISRTKSQSLKVSCILVQLSSRNPLKPDVKLRMKMYLEQRRQAMLQLHLSYQQFYCLLRCNLY